MLPFRNVRIANQIAVRIIADAVMVGAGMLTGLTIRFLWLLDMEDIEASRALLSSFRRIYVTEVWYLLVISLIVFALSGFYTRGRAYRGRYKALIVAQAVSLSYLILGFLAFLFPHVFTIPASSLIPAWFFTLVYVMGARLWTKIWSRIVRIEDRLYPRETSGDEIKNILVIGGAGYIGSALLPKLLTRGYHVRVLDLLMFGREPIANVMNHPDLEIIQGDFRQVDRVVEAMRGMDAVIHLGALVGDPACALDEELTIEVNLMATRMIAEVAKGSDVSRFIFASTCSVYGACDEFLDERSLLKPVSLYARSKIASEKVLMRMADSLFAPVILRFGTIFGISGRTRFDLVVNLLTAKAMVDGQITVMGGEQWRPFIHVDDAALAILKAIEMPQNLVRNQIYNVGCNDLNYTIREIGDIIYRLIPTATLVSSGSDGDRRNYRVNFSKARNQLGFVPQWTVEQGILQVSEAIRTGKVKDYRDAQYSNVKYLNQVRASDTIRRQNGWAYALLNDPTYAYWRGDRRQAKRRKINVGPPPGIPERRNGSRRRLGVEGPIHKTPDQQTSLLKPA